MVGLWTLLGQLLMLAALSAAKSSTGSSVLVLLEPALKRDDYSIFFKGLQKNGYDLTFRAPKDVSPAIIEDGVPSFAHVILLAPETKAFASDVTPQDLVELLALDTNVLFVLGQKQTILTSLAAEFSLILPPPGTPLISHFPARSENATVVPISPPSDSALTSTTTPIWFTGSPHALSNNPLLFPLLNAPPESFAADSSDDKGSDAIVDAAERGGEGLWAGSQMSVATGFQARSGARATWVGGASLFSDEYANKASPSGGKSGNEQFARDLAAWTFQESLVLRIDSTTHHRVDETEPRDHYTTSDRVTYTAHISKYDPKTGEWEPYSGVNDIQLEFTMLDPHIRTALPPVAGRPGEYSVTFRIPDRHGVFKFVVDYKRKGWSYLHSSTTIPIVPPRHDEYPRFISAAWPYYVGAISTSIGFLVFSAIWLAGDDGELRKKKATKVE